MHDPLSDNHIIKYHTSQSARKIAKFGCIKFRIYIAALDQNSETIAVVRDEIPY